MGGNPGFGIPLFYRPSRGIQKNSLVTLFWRQSVTGGGGVRSKGKMTAIVGKGKKMLAGSLLVFSQHPRGVWAKTSECPLQKGGCNI